MKEKQNPRSPKTRVFTLSKEDFVKTTNDNDIKEKLEARFNTSDKAYNIAGLMVEVFKYNKTEMQKNMSQWKPEDKKFYQKVRGAVVQMVKDDTLDSKKVEGVVWFIKK